MNSINNENNNSALQPLKGHVKINAIQERNAELYMLNDNFIFLKKSDTTIPLYYLPP
jgi:hypothetical protein